jgi:hypothetical protein
VQIGRDAIEDSLFLLLPFQEHMAQRVGGRRGGTVVFVGNALINGALVASATFAKRLATGIIIGKCLLHVEVLQFLFLLASSSYVTVMSSPFCFRHDC